MRFEPDADQRDFAAALDALLAGADTPAVARAWAAGDHAPGLALWRRLADQGVTSLAVPDSGATAVDLAVAFERLGWWAVPGPWAESAAFLPRALAEPDPDRIGTVAIESQVPWALDADVADDVYLEDANGLRRATPGEPVRSVDPTRHLFAVTPGEAVPASDLGDLADGVRWAALATAAQLLGCGERVLADSVAYVKQRRQFGREIGSYQAIKHALADVRIALDFARPLLQGASLSLARTDVAAAKLACGDAAYLASRTGLQVHGAIGYTAELDLSLWLTRIRALLTSWGTPARLRQGILDELVGAR